MSQGEKPFLPKGTASPAASRSASPRMCAAGCCGVPGCYGRRKHLSGHGEGKTESKARAQKQPMNKSTSNLFQPSAAPDAARK